MADTSNSETSSPPAIQACPADRAVAAMEESRDDADKVMSESAVKGEEEIVDQDREKPASSTEERDVGAIAAAKEDAMAMDVSNEPTPSSKDRANEKKENETHIVESNATKDGTFKTISQESEKSPSSRPEPINTATVMPLKRPRSSTEPLRDAPKEQPQPYVSVDDDTPKHINISHSAHGSSTGIGGAHFFRYDSSKRSKLSEGGSSSSSRYQHHPPPPPPHDLSQTRGRSYSLESVPEGDKDQPHPLPQSYHHHDGYYYDRDHHPSHPQSRDDHHHYPPTPGQVREAWTSTLHPSHSTHEHDYPEPASYLTTTQTMSWEVPAGTLSAIGSTLSFGGPGGTIPSTPTAEKGEVQVVEGEEGAKSNLHEKEDGKPEERDACITDGGKESRTNHEDNADEDDIPPILSVGSNLPPRKRSIVLSPRPSAPSNKLFEPPRPKHQGGRESPGRSANSRQEGRQVEPRGLPRDKREPANSRYAPTTVHYPHERRQAPPPVRSYSHDYHTQPSPRYGSDPNYDSRYRDYEPPRGGPHGGPPPSSSHHGSYDRHPAGRYQESPRDVHHARGSDRSSRDPYRSPQRYPSEYVESHEPLKTPPYPPTSAPWGTPPSSSGRKQHLGENRMLSPHGTPGTRERDHENDTGSFDSSLSRRSFRSLDDLEEPMTSLLYRPSFSWERGIESNSAPSNAGGGGGHHGHSSHHPSSGGHPGGHHSHHHPTGHGYGHPTPSHGGHHSGAGHSGHSLNTPTTAAMIQLRDQQKIMKALTMRSEIRTIGNPSGNSGLILLLAMPQDRHCLSETLCIVRNNVEVFTATDADINAPAPGRKRPIQIGQVGLRCVYCRMCNTRDRVKRATCFPSSMKRIYRAVIDMKLDHFKNCPYVPQGLKNRLDQLQAGSTRSTGMTVQYFVKSAQEMGMVDLEDGVSIDLKRVGKAEVMELINMNRKNSRHRQEDRGMVPSHHQQHDHHYGGPPPMTYPKQKGRYRQHQHHHQHQEAKFAPQMTVSSNAPPPFQAEGGELVTSSPQHHDQSQQPPLPSLPDKRYSGKVLLTLPEDKNFLSPLRCFLREHVCAFTATARDIAVRTPTTFSVRVGQVGVGCIHCLSVPPKSRSNRAVCFPFTVARIYQSVADIQRFHLGECRMMPAEVRTKFLRLQSESAKGSRGLATRTYWIDSAKKIGLADGPAGMYFYRDPSLPPPPPVSDPESLDILGQVANGDSIGKQPLVTLEDKPTIAEFLYLVMEQLRPCRFTDADRNKRRSKNVGSIGVECKHCAGKIDGRKFFWSSVSAAESNFVSVHSHMLACKYIPADMKVELTRLKALRREQTSRLKTGSQKAFFTRVWARLHGTPVPVPEAPVKVLASPPHLKGDGTPKLAKKIHPKRNMHAMKEVVIEAPLKTNPVKSNTSNEVSLVGLHKSRSNDSDEIRVLLESKSTLSSMPSMDESMILKHANTQETLQIEEIGGNSGSDGELKTGQSNESAGEQASKSSLTSVALNLSAVSVHCKEERN